MKQKEDKCLKFSMKLPDVTISKKTNKSKSENLI